MADHDLDHRDDTGTGDDTDARRRGEHDAVEDAIEYFSPDSPPETGEQGREIAYAAFVLHGTHDEAELVAAVRAAGVVVDPLGPYHAGAGPPMPGFAIGFGAAGPDGLGRGLDVLAGLDRAPGAT